MSRACTRLLLGLLLAAGSVASATGLKTDQAQTDHERSEFICTEVLNGTEKGDIIVRHDGLSKEYAEQGRKDAEAARDVLQKLGVPTPPHQIIFAPERQLNILSATGVLPFPHAISGAQIFEAMRKGSNLGVLEFAQPGGHTGGHSGCSTCRSYYSNTTALHEQRPIYFHVGGHNHVFLRSLISRMRNTDPIAASDTFAKKMEEMYQTHGVEPVSLFFHYLNVAAQLQDYQDGTFTSPDELTPQKSAMQEVPVQQGSGNWAFMNGAKKEKRYPWERTPSVLQFEAANLPPQIAPYKRELTAAYEAVVRVYPAVMAQKFVHEGWATFLMMLGQKHSKWNSDKDVFDFARVVSGAAGGPLNVGQPYSMGLACFNHLYQRFKRGPELKGLNELATDALFVKYIDSLLPTLTDSRLFELVIDQEFVDRHKLTLARHGTPEEMAEHVERAKAAGVPEDKLPNGLLISKSADRIRNKIIRQVGVKDIPGFLVVNPAMGNPYQLTLEQRVVEDKPLEPVSAAQVLFAQTQVTELPVSATMLLSGRFLPSPVPGTFAARMEVRPDGRVRVFKRATMNALTPNVQEDELPSLSAQLNGAVDYYRTDQSFSFSDKVNEEDERRWEQMFPKMIGEEVAKANLNSVGAVVDYAPTAARAIMEFSKLLKARFARQMEAAMQGKLKLKFGPNGVKMPLVPMSPNLQYDQEHKSDKPQQLAPVDTIQGRAANMMANFSADIDDGSLMGPSGGSVGDPTRLPPQGGGGGASKSGKDQGEEEESQPEEVTIPANLYRQILAMHFEIPNARETDGETTMMKDIRMGERRDSSEEPLWEKMAADALVKAIIARRAKGDKNPYASTPAAQLIREGFAKLDEEDYIIRSKREVPIPSFDAVVLVFVDLSGSVQGNRLEMIRNMVWNVRELFRAVYPDVKFRYIGHSDKAKEYTEKEIWDAFMSGGTYHTPPVKLAKDILKQYPMARWNRYAIFAGDGETADLQSFMKEFAEIQPTLQHMGLIVARDPGEEPGADPNGMRAAFEAYKTKWPWITQTQVEETGQIFRGLGDLYGKKSK